MARAGRQNNEWAVSKLAVQPRDAVLEIGFGPGVAIQRLAEMATQGFIAGVDPSDVMVGQAQKRNRKALMTGRVELKRSSVSSLPYEDGIFDKVLSVNNVMMWPQPERDLKEVLRVLKPGGKVVLVLQPRWVKTRAEVEAIGREIAAHISSAGFSAPHVEVREMQPVASVAVSALRPGE